MHARKNAFTLMEVMVVIVILAMIAAFMIPNYGKAIAKADERNMIANLKSMRTAIDLYTVNGTSIGVWNSLATVNDNLGLSLIDTKATYACQDAGGQTNRCTATHSRGWAIRFYEEYANGLLFCSAGTCPSCPAQPGNCG